jgi:hypothetical protein
MNDEEEYYAVPVIPVDGMVHNQSGFCYDLPHECHENGESIADLNTAIQAGEITTTDADRIYRGQTV